MITLYAVIYRLPQTGKVVGDIYDDFTKAVTMADTVKESHGCNTAIEVFRITEGRL